MPSKELITQLYVGYFDRAPDPAGLDFWITVLDNGLSLEAIAIDFSTQPESQNTYAYLDALIPPGPASGGSDIEAFITAIYDNLFDRAPDAPGLAFWTGVLEGGFPPGSFILAIIDGASPADEAILQNKVDVACAWVENADAEPGFTLTQEYIDASGVALGEVSDDPATVTAGKDAADLFFQDAPSVALSGTITTLPEDTDLTARLKVADIVVTDDGIGTNDLSLSGTDAALFEIDGTELFLIAGTGLDFETATTLDVTVEVDDAGVGASPDDTAALSIAITDVNDAPAIALTAQITVLDEDADTSAAIKVANIEITDDALGTNDLSLSGDDAALFEIVGSELFLKAGTTLDFDSNASLDVTVAVDDATVGVSPDDTADLSIGLVDVNEAPSVALDNAVITLPEDTDLTARLKVADIVVTDDIPGSNVLSLSGDDAALFEIDGDELFLIAGAALDFETNGTLDVTVEVDDAGVGVSPDDSATLAITVTDVNEAPSVALDNTVTTLAEDADTSAAIKMADIVVTDDGTGTNTLSLTGADAALFEIVGTELFLKAGSALDFESNPALDVSVEVNDATVGTDPDDSAGLSVAITDVNEAPTVALAGALIAIAETEDTSSRIKVADIVISDDALGTNTLALTGADAALFEIDGTELFLKAGTVLDFEVDAALDVTVEIEDGSVGGSPDDSAALTIAVTDTNDAPTVAVTNVPASLPEDTDITARLKVGDIIITDDLAGVNTLSLAGADAALFEIDGTELFLKAGTVLDFETDAVLDVTVEVDDPTLGAGVEDSAVLAIPVTNVNEVPSVSLGAPLASIAEDASTASRIKVADIIVGDDGTGTNDLSLSGDDAALFEIDGTELFLKAGTALDFETDAALDVTVEVDDASVGASPDDSASLTLAVTDVNDPPSVTLVSGGSAIFEGTDTTSAMTVATIQVTDDAQGTNVLGLTGTDAALFEIVGTALQLKAGTALDAVANPSLDVTVTVDDVAVGASPDDSDSLSIAVAPGVPGLASNNTPAIVISGNSSSVLRAGQIEVADADPDTPGDQPGFVFNTDPNGTPYAGVAGDVLTLIDVTGLDGLASFGVIAQADPDDFTLDNSGSAGDVDACLGEGNVFGVLMTPMVSSTGTWTFDNTGASGSMEIEIKAVDVAAGGTLDFNNVDICITGDVDLTDAVLDIDAASTLAVAEDGVLTLSVDQAETLAALGGGTFTIAGEGTLKIVDGTGNGDDADFGALLGTGTVDMSGVTLTGADSDGFLVYIGQGAKNKDGEDITQTIVGSSENDGVGLVGANVTGTAPTLTDGRAFVLDMGEDDGDIGDPAMIGTIADLTEATGDVFSIFLAPYGTDDALRYVVDDGFDQGQVVDNFEIQIGANGAFVGDFVTGGGATTTFTADANTFNNGTGVLRSIIDDATLDMTAAGGTSGWYLIGSASATSSDTLIGSANADTLIDGAATDADNDGQEDEFTGNGGADMFNFGVERSQVAEAALTVVADGADFEEIDVNYTTGATGETLRFEFIIGATSPAFVTIVDPGTDFSTAAGVASALAAAINARSDASATVTGDIVTARGIDGRQFDLLAVVEDPNGAANTVTGSFVQNELDDILDYADDPTDPEAGAGDNDDRTEVTLDFTGAVNDGEEYTITIRRSDGSEFEANHTVSGGESLQDVVDALAADLNANSGAFQLAYSVGTGAVPADATQTGAAAADQIVIYDTDQINGGFEVILTSGGSAVAATSSVIALGSSSILDGTETSLADADADVITDFMTGMDMIDFAELAAGDGSNYAEGAAPVTDDFVGALADATAEFTANGTTYYMTSTSGDGGLLFYDVNGDGDADGVVNLTGVDATTFAATDIA